MSTASDDAGGGGSGRLLLFVVAVDGVELGHPAREHGLFAQAVDLGQRANALLDVVLEHVAEVCRRATARLHHFGDAVGLEEDLVVGADRVCECLVCFHVVHAVLEERFEVILK